MKLVGEVGSETMELVAEVGRCRWFREKLDGIHRSVELDDARWLEIGDDEVGSRSWRVELGDGVGR